MFLSVYSLRAGLGSEVLVKSERIVLRSHEIMKTEQLKDQRFFLLKLI